MKMFLKKSPLTRMIVFLAGDMILLSLSLYLSFLFRFDWDIPAHYTFGLYIPVFVATRIPVFFFFRLYSMSWSFAGAYELIGVAKGLTLGTMLIAFVVYVINPDGIFTGFPRSIVLLDYVLSVLFVGSFRRQEDSIFISWKDLPQKVRGP